MGTGKIESPQAIRRARVRGSEPSQRTLTICSIAAAKGITAWPTRKMPLTIFRDPAVVAAVYDRRCLPSVVARARRRAGSGVSRF